MNRLVPRQAVPELQVKTLNGGDWCLSEQESENFTLILVYRGLHCPVCKPYVRDLDRKLDEFYQRGITVLAVSSDTQARAEQARQDWGIGQLDLGYGLSIASARDWGLYISSSRGKTSIGIEEPEQFVEPGLFIVRPNGELYASMIQTMPFARPHFDEILKALDFIVDKDYPARGEA